MKVSETTFGIEVFANQTGGITIQQDGTCPGDESIICLDVALVPALIRALREAKAEAKQ